MGRKESGHPSLQFVLVSVMHLRVQYIIILRNAHLLILCLLMGNMILALVCLLSYLPFFLGEGLVTLSWGWHLPSVLQKEA